VLAIRVVSNERAITISKRVFDRRLDGSAVADVAWVGSSPHAELPEDRAGSIARSIIHHEKIELRHGFAEPLDDGRDCRLFVIRGDGDENTER
jgi:hypothetical protein